MQSHMIIASHIHTNISHKLNINLSKSFLTYGSMIPDVTPLLAARKHYKKQSFDFVLDLIENLISDGLHENTISINKFSSKLGIITHFLSDFFCLPHHNREYYHDKLIKHLSYENKLHDYFTHFCGLDKIRIPYMQHIDRDNIKSFIEELHHTYSTHNSGFLNDVKSSINVSCAISSILIEHSYSNILDKVTV